MTALPGRRSRPQQRRTGHGTGGLLHGSATYGQLRDEAVALRREGLSRRQIRDRLGVGNNDLLNGLLAGEPAPEWTRRPNAKDGLRARARELRLRGWTYDRIELELGVSRSSVSRWVRDLPKPPRGRSAETAETSVKPWDHERPLREAARRRMREDARREIGAMTDRELFLVGTGLYWAEGSKSKPHRPRATTEFVNSDTGVIEVFLAWLDLLGIEPGRRRYRVLIHDSADVAAAEAYWADLVGVEVSAFGKTTLKRHDPKTVRKNAGAGYRGCLVVRVLQGADVYRRIEGWWYGIVEASNIRRGGDTQAP